MMGIKAGGTGIIGRAHGRPKPWQQMITLRPDPEGVIHDSCSCRVRSNCQHVAAPIEVEPRSPRQWVASARRVRSHHNGDPRPAPQNAHETKTAEAQTCAPAELT